MQRTKRKNARPRGRRALDVRLSVTTLAKRWESDGYNLLITGKRPRHRMCSCENVHLRTLCERAGDMAPDERLACGIEYKKHWSVDPPPELAALAFWRPGDPIGPIPVPEGAHPSDDFDY